MASREEQEYSTQAPAGYIGNFLQQGIFPYAQKFLNQQFQNYGEADSSPFTYSGQRVADFDPREQYAMDMSDQAIGSYKPYLGEQANLLREAGSMNRAGTRAGAQAYRRAEDTGMGSTREFDPNMAQQFYNPFEEDVVQQTLTDAREGLAKGDMALRDQAVQGGAFGGARGRINQEELARNVGRGTAEAIGGIRQAGFTGARDAAMGSFEAQQGRQAGLAGLQAEMGQGYGQMGGNLGAGLAGYGQSFGGMGGALQGLQGADINRIMGMGGLGRGRQQSLMDLGYQNFTGQYNLPMSTLANVGSLTAALGPMAGGYGYAGGAPTSNTNFNPASGNIPNIGGPQQGGGGPQRPPGGGGGRGGEWQEPRHRGPGSMGGSTIGRNRYINARPDFTPNQLITDQKQWTPRDEKPQDTAYGPPKGWTPQGGGQPQDSGVWSGPGHQAIQLPASFKQKQWGGVSGRERGNKQAVRPQLQTQGPGPPMRGYNPQGGKGWTPQGGGQGGGARKANGGAIRNTGMASLLPYRRRR